MFYTFMLIIIILAPVVIHLSKGWLQYGNNVTTITDNRDSKFFPPTDNKKEIQKYLLESWEYAFEQAVGADEKRKEYHIFGGGRIPSGNYETMLRMGQFADPANAVQMPTLYRRFEQQNPDLVRLWNMIPDNAKDYLQRERTQVTMDRRRLQVRDEYNTLMHKPLDSTPPVFKYHS